MRFPGSLISSRLRPGERKWHARPYQADAVNEKKTLNAAGGSLILTNENVEVGKFSLMHVLGCGFKRNNESLYRLDRVQVAGLPRPRAQTLRGQEQAAFPYWKELGRRVHREVGQHLLGGSEGQVDELDDEVGPTVLIQ
jgi:hypothetical protein